jgi:RND family efflux transporter MFP subunit
MKAIIKILIPLLILGLGVAVMIVMIKKRSAPVKAATVQMGVLVTTAPVELVTHTVIVRGSATVMPSEQISVVPQVGGEVIKVSKNFVAGGKIPKGKLLFVIDDTDYTLQYEGTLSALARAEYEYESVERQAEIARLEWDTISHSDESPNPLVLYEPQLKNARAALQAAQAQVDLAQLSVKRTRVRAPFNARVRVEQISLGQVVMPGASVGTIAGTNKAEVTVAVPVEDLAWIDLPAPAGTASVLQGNRVFSASVMRTAAEVDPQTHMVNVIVEVLDPFALKTFGAPELLLGSFVEVTIKGHKLENVFVFPRKILHDDDTIWVMGADDTLSIKSVDVLRIEGDKVIVRSVPGEDELISGEIIVTSNISGAVDGLKLRATTALEAR